MPKSKYAPALFEVMDSGKDQKSASRLHVPNWWGRGKREKPADSPESGTPETAAAAPSAPEGAEPVTRPHVSPSSSPDAAVSARPAVEPIQAAPAVEEPKPPVRPMTAAPEGTEGGDRPPILRVEEGRVELSLTSINALVGAGILLLLIFVAFQLGQLRTGSDPVAVNTGEPTPELEELQKGPQQPGVLQPPPPPVESSQGSATGGSRAVAPGATNSGNPAETPGQATPETSGGQADTRTAGLNYVYVESFKPEHKQYAEHAQAWLRTKNVETLLLRADNGWWQLVSNQGYDSARTGELRRAEEQREAIKSLGREYKQEYGTRVLYNFRDPAIRKFTG